MITVKLMNAGGHMINEAIQFATKAHEGQFRKSTQIPYILHPLEAAIIVSHIKFDEEVIAAAILHDIIEETSFKEKDIRSLFGDRVAALVAAETEDKTKTWEERKQYTIDHLAHEKDRDVLIVTMGDKLSNIRAVYHDWLELGDELWKRFNKGRESQQWYYNSLVESLKDLDPIPEYLEFKELVELTFKNEAKKMKSVKLKDIIDGLEMQSDEYHTYLNTETGDIVTVGSEELGIMEESDEDEDFSGYPDWQQNSIKKALDIELSWGSGKFIKLPGKRYINDYDIMEAFIGSLGNDRISNSLYTAIQGRGAFRRFKDTICRFGIEESWYEFRDEALKELAIRWCEDNNVVYIE